MTWSYRIATVRGIALKVHVTFAIIVFIVATAWSAHGPAGVAFGVGLMLLLFACVTLHEFGHAAAAQYFGIPVREIVLLPIGGVALLGRNPRTAVQELVIAVAGPVVNVAIVAALLPALIVLGEPLTLSPAFLRPDTGASLSLGEAVRWLVGANMSLVLFNMVPAFPLDGGRILRGILGLWVDWTRATRWATVTGQVLAFGMGAYGVMAGQISLLIIAVLVFAAAGATNADEQARTILATQRVGDACNRHALSLTEADRLSSVVRYLLTSYQPDFPVMRGRDLLGVVQRNDVLKALAQRSADVPVAALMTVCPRVHADLSLADVHGVFQESDGRVAAVYDDRGFVGLVGVEDIREAEIVLSFVQRPVDVVAQGDGPTIAPSAARWASGASRVRSGEPPAL
jgi:Zn-dependent protease